MFRNCNVNVVLRIESEMCVRTQKFAFDFIDDLSVGDQLDICWRTGSFYSLDYVILG